MAKEMVYFNATKQIETITIHYNQKLDGVFVDEIAQSIKDVAKKMSKIDLKNPKEYDNIQVFIYPSKQLFYRIFGGEIEKRFYSRRRSLEDLYVVQDDEGNIHIVSPRGMAQEKREELKKILVIKVLGEYMDEKERQSALILLKQSLKPKEEEKEQFEEVEEIEPEEELDEQEVETEQDDLEEKEDIEEELDEEELEDIIETELIMEQIDEEQDTQDMAWQQEDGEVKKEKDQEEIKVNKRSEAQDWLNIGWLAYVRGRLKKEEDIKRFAENISINGIKKLGQLSDTRLLESYNFSREYACAWVEYIITTYGMKKFVEHYENPKDIRGVFGVSKFVFEAQLKAYIKEKYIGENKVLNITEDIKLDDIVHDEQGEKEQRDPIAELTVLHFSTTGGVDIITAEPMEREPLSIGDIG